MRSARKGEMEEMEEADEQQLRDIKEEMLRKFGKNYAQDEARRDLQRDDFCEISRRSQIKGMLDELCVSNGDKEREIEEMEGLLEGRAREKQGAPSIYACNR
jgi:hypothetical protein